MTIVRWLRRYVDRKVDEVMRPRLESLTERSVSTERKIDDVEKDLRALNGSGHHRHNGSF